MSKESAPYTLVDNLLLAPSGKRRSKSRKRIVIVGERGRDSKKIVKEIVRSINFLSIISA